MANNIFEKIEKYLAKYRLLIGVLVLIMLITVSILTYYNFDKQAQIIETGGFIDGDIKCVCSQEAWNTFILQEEDINVSYVNTSNG